MLKFLRLGTEAAPLEKRPVRRTLRRLVGHIGLGYAVKLWSLDSLLDRIPKPQPHAILDFGCSDGLYSFHIHRRWPKATLVGVDGDADAIRRASAIAEHMSANTLKFRYCLFDEYTEATEYDLVLCLDALHYTDKGLHYLARICARARPGGYLIFSIPRPQRHYNHDFDYYTGHVDVVRQASLYTVANTTRVMREAGVFPLAQIDYPSSQARRVIEDQRAGYRYVRLFYPLTLIYTWLVRKGDEGQATHYMVLARRPEVR